MKKKRIVLVIVISALSLIGLVILQINWILHAARLQEEQLKHRITIASAQIGNMLSNDSLAAQSLLHEIEQNRVERLVIPIDRNSREKIAAILRQQFRYHQLDLEYEFSIVDKRHIHYVASCRTDLSAHGLCLDNIVKPQQAELRIHFLNTNFYVFSQMRWMLVCSFVMISLIHACFSLPSKPFGTEKTF
ncbi:MAG: hypothetical protein HC880_14210 [Bacteroidia bacterium]|nr:hypothetical protein [Bacteroidia bacterium]